MLLLVCLILILIGIVLLVIFLKRKQIFSKYNNFFTLLIVIIVLLITFFIIIKFIIPLIPHNDVSKEDRNLLESYILNNYGLELKVTESTIIHRGNIGINPGIEYNFVLKNNDGFEFRLNINELAEIDLKTILSANPELSIIQMK